MKKIYLIIYYLLGVRFPTQPVPGYKIGYKLRRILIQHIAEECGRDIVVKQGCYVGSGVGLRIGDRSQLGHNAKIGQFVTIGDDVVMGPDVVIMANSHAFDNLDIPINQQGALPVRP
ncbi:MAG: acyltransferase, partial [Gammaproteobacteria bacterium]